MSAGIDVTVKVNGALFSKNVSKVMRDAVVTEALQKVDERLMRKGRYGSGGKGIGVKRNYVTHNPQFEMTAPQTTVMSTLLWPRTTGSKWVGKNIAIVKAMLPRVLRKYANRVVEELGG